MNKILLDIWNDNIFDIQSDYFCFEEFVLASCDIQFDDISDMFDTNLD